MSNPYPPPGGYDPYGQNPYGQNPYGQNPYGPPGQGPPRNEPLAVASLVCSLIGLLCCGVSSILGVVFGHIALGRISNDPSLDGATMAKAGLIIGYIVIGLTILVLVVGIATGLLQSTVPNGY